MKKIIKYLLIISLPGLIVLVSLIFNNNWGYAELKYRLGPYSSSFKYIEKVARTFDFNDLKGTKSLEDSQRIELIIKPIDLETLKQYGSHNPAIKKWVVGQLGYLGDSINVKVKLHGTDRAHYVNNKFSYTIKIIEDNKWFKSDRYKLIKGEEFGPSNISLNNFASKSGLISASSRMIELKINNQLAGHYCFSQDIKKSYLNTYFQTSNWSVLANNEDWSRKENSYLPGHLSDFDSDYYHIKGNKKDSLFPKALLAYKEMMGNIRNGELNSLQNFIDVEYMGKFLALASLFNDCHFLSGDNVKYIYNHENKKFYPLFRIESSGTAAPNKLKTLSGETVDLSYPFYDQLLWESYNKYFGEKNQLFFKACLRNSEVRTQRNIELLNLVNNEKSFLTYIEKMYEENASVVNEYILSRRAYELVQSNQEVFIKDHLKLSKDYLKYGHIYSTYNLKSKNSVVVADVFSPIEIWKGGVLLQQNNSFNLSENFERSYNVFKVDLNLSEEKNVFFINTVTKDTIKNVYSNVISE